jgi:hypothetical protein
LAKTILGQPYRVVLHGLPHFCQKLSAMLCSSRWDIQYQSRHNPVELAARLRNLQNSDLAYMWGGRISLGKFLGTARLLGKNKLIMLWSGSDVLFAKEELADGRMHPWVKGLIHWAVSPWIAEEVRDLGLRCEYVQASFVQPEPVPVPLPEKFSVLAYVPSREKSSLYGWDQIVEVAAALPSIQFNIVGLQTGGELAGPPNVRVHGWTNDLTPHLRQTTVLWRPVRHDGLSFMVLEALAQGRHVLYSYPFSACAHVKSSSAACAELERLYALHRSGALEINHTGGELITREFSPEKVCADLLRRWEEIILSPDTARVEDSDRGQFSRSRVAAITLNEHEQMPLRTSRGQAKRRVLVHGLVYFGRMFADLMSGDGWEFRYYPDSGLRNLTSIAVELKACDIVYQIGGRVTQGKFLSAARLLGKKKFVMHWVGSDTLDGQKEVAQGKGEPWVLQQIHHWAESDWMVGEVEALGIPCDLVPLPSARIPEQPLPLPRDFSVLVYMPDVRRGELYGLDRILRVARELPHIPFELVGLMHGQIPDPPSNLKIHGRIPNLQEFYRGASVVWRPVRHDGLSYMVLEALGYGRHVMWSYPFPGCVQTSCESEARNEIVRLYSLHKHKGLHLNCPGVQAIRDGGYLPQRLRKEILSHLEHVLSCERAAAPVA